MKFTTSTLAAAGGMIASANAHGFITSPQARMPGDAMQSACGTQVYYNQMGDNYGNVQGELQVASSQDDYKADPCNIWMCKGFKFEDNKDNAQSYTPGQNVDFTVDIRAPHTGYANVSIVKTSSNTMISDMLKKWDVYASTSTPVPDADKEFSITMPSDLGDECATAGDCVIQWYWNAPDIDQTYEACVDFTMSGSGSGSNSGSDSSPAPSSTQAAGTTSQAAASSAPAITKVAETTSKVASSTTTSEAVASTCACTNQKREVFGQEAASCASTTVVTSTAWATATTTAEHTKTVTATVTAQATDMGAADKARKDLKGRSGNRTHPRDLAMN
ncbi:hypothetical protein KC332_g6303 [Hortaea werneckii]|uniref:Chitin-binding type-4 domain-containing protein n=2 Tax=Hortaea werneckii TaxID=91943 RepID=A0A3M7IWM8_HORWE|nr:hypothetical protein KC358_g5009 [Hortaea werneckii]OTA35359.1 hypothetical protein BTJ68_03274 [Hortaea werneckii EXF-2000]KAI6839776.1 hypothetical protein KC350_g5585 [Hortaea werneckii]KAI6935141.1 hypothetical protein KC348_g6325 [Hortaea werneckii]KAI6938561.1 hypothetical protein KC341_g4813 [Hortaea werneckii]